MVFQRHYEKAKIKNRFVCKIAARGICFVIIVKFPVFLNSRKVSINYCTAIWKSFDLCKIATLMHFMSNLHHFSDTDTVMLRISATLE